MPPRQRTPASPSRPWLDCRAPGPVPDEADMRRLSPRQSGLGRHGSFTRSGQAVTPALRQQRNRAGARVVATSPAGVPSGRVVADGSAFGPASMPEAGALTPAPAGAPPVLPESDH